MAKAFGSRWRVRETIGEGGQAFVYLVADESDPATNEPFVLKRLKNHRRLERFRREWQAISQLDHPNIVRAVDHDLDDNPAYIVFEYCSGGPLSSSAPFWRGDIRQTLSLFEQILDAVHHANSRRIIHRDLKPDNILLRGPNGPPVVADFGLSLLLEEHRLTSESEAVGPKCYMAPEFEDGRLEEPVTTADMYSLGKILYWLCSGRVFARERHRDPAFDLRTQDQGAPGGWAYPEMEHMNAVLDHMITADPIKRSSVAVLKSLLQRLPSLVEGRYRIPNKNQPQPCLFCGKGAYAVADHSQHMPGQNISGQRWIYLVCEQCGHVQSFRVDMARLKARHWMP